ncbi:DMT family transporter [Mesorhizobium sp. 1B3]|uniref:DMT family transporter n=1 Tax=Mesorhizobium sp. 1B3 TaxID=3243599 RepID=UPI003D9563D7
MLLSSNLRGALFMSVSMAAFTLNDAITKAVSASMNMGQVMLVRGLFATLLVGLIVWHGRALGTPRAALQPMVVLRVLGEVGATLCFLLALAHLPIANVSAVLQALPLAVTMGAALVFKEPVGWRRWLAISIGFLGVLIVVRPGFEGFSTYSLLALASVFFCAVRDLATTRIPTDVPTFLVSAATATAVMVMGAATVQPMGGWTPLTFKSAALLATAALLLIIGYHFIIEAMRAGAISFIAPFRYTALLWSILLGFVIFGDVPDTAMIAGATIIIGSGVYALYRERVAGKGMPATKSTGPAMIPDGM